jgi:hypothetical protein
VSPGQSRITSLDPAGGNRRAELPVSEIGLGHNHQSGSVAVQPVHDSRPSLGATGQGRATCDQRVDESIVPVPRCRMDHEARGFVDDGEMLVLEDEREWNGSRADGAGSFVLGNLNSNCFTAPQNSRCARDFSIDGHQFVGYQPGCLSSRDSQLISKEFVQPLARGRQSSEFEVLPRPFTPLRAGSAVPLLCLHISQPERTPLRPFARLLARGKWQERSRRS